MHDVVFNRVSVDVFKRLEDQVLGIHEGRAVRESVVEVSGVLCAYHYDPADQTLQVSVLSTPRVITQGYVIGLVHDALRRLETEPTTTP